MPSNKVRLKLTPSLRDDDLHLLLEWVEVDQCENIVCTLASEEFLVDQATLGTVSYVSRGEFPEGEMRKGTFWLDQSGLRHFYMSAQAGQLSLFGEEMEGRKG